MADLEAPQSQEYQLKSQHKCQIMSSYMLESFEADAMSIAVVAVDKHRHLKDIAYHITHTYNKKYAAGSGKAMDGVYHCCVGKSFASEYRAPGWPMHSVPRPDSRLLMIRCC